MTHPTRSHRLGGFLLMELAIALVVIGGLVALMVPLWTMQGQLDSARQDSLRMQQAREALLRQAVVGSGLPAPVRFKESAVGNGLASSHTELTSTLATLAPGWPGGLPGHLLGVATVSPLKTVYWYDVQPALRSDAGSGFYPLVASISDVWSFEGIVQQFDPDLNPNLSSGGNPSQLCRNLNSLQALDQSIRVHTGVLDPGLYRRDHINVTLPRIWATGYESQFYWDGALGYAGFSGATTALDDAFNNSSAVAFTVLRRQPAGLRRLDRQNTVYRQVGLTGLDTALADRGDLTYPAFAAERGFRIYENPLTPTVDDPTSDENDYGGLVAAVSLGEFADSLRQAGLCKAPAEACKANQLFVRFANYVSSAPPSGSAERLTLRWQLVNQAVSPEEIVNSGDVNSGSTTDGICLDAFSTGVATTASDRYLRVSFISPAGTVGYTSAPAWYRGGVLVDPSGDLPAADDGINRWRNLDALAAAEGGKTVTVSCTGAHTVSVAGELERAGASLPTCTVTQLP
ncbi:type II secretion system protein [Hydrogenophaga sp.]|uniref:type II secretion system protein n=1 Tax=Hydrogenophaga sp. TaxID=1904254 RepID=UPI003F6D5C18